jgi:hypothetical protein
MEVEVVRGLTFLLADKSLDGRAEGVVEVEETEEEEERVEEPVVREVPEDLAVHMEQMLVAELVDQVDLQGITVHSPDHFR